MTTHDWEKLLDGSTPGPWEVLEIKGTRLISHPLSGGSGWSVAMVLQEDDQGLEEANARVLAAAPDAVAEVIRLRRAIEALRESLAGRAETLRGTRQYVAAVGITETAHTLTRILERGGA